MRFDAALGPAEIARLPERDWAGTGAVVFDVLRATSSILTALDSGASAILPAETVEEALALKRHHPDALLGGERRGDRIDGFDLGNSPREYLGLAGKTVVTTTTNGTVALRRCLRAERTFVGALLNRSSLARALAGSGLRHFVLVCAGTFETPALEDAAAAGALCAAFPDADLTDAARMTLAVWREAEPDPRAHLLGARNGRALEAAGRARDVDDCARLDALEAVGEQDREGVIRLVRPAGGGAA